MLLPGLADEAAIALHGRGAQLAARGFRRRASAPAAAQRLGFAESALTALRLEGPAPSVAFRAEALVNAFGSGPTARRARKPRRFWREIGDVAPLPPPDGRVVWRLCPTPSAAPALTAAIRANFASADGFYDWGGGLVWLASTPPRPAPTPARPSSARRCKPLGGHATLVVASAAMRESVAVFEPEAPRSGGVEPARSSRASIPPASSIPAGCARGREMQTHFTLAQLADSDIREADKILRACVHCGFCTATCPTYVLLGDELDGPRGRIYLIKDMLENDRPADAETVKHIDRCLSCLSCMTTCPSGVNYMHLVDHARHQHRTDLSRARCPTG